mmetsp:Transcript_7453/g.16274  ORF Transcript_7453/g.16274 Transcript_7453/m.16274 type:complete len:255 (+) Transcript_7453:64-828(+)
MGCTQATGTDAGETISRSSKAKLEKVCWLALESNPDVLNTFSWQVGLPNIYEFVDVVGLDFDSLQTVPGPVLAVLLLYKYSNTLEKFKQEQRSQLTPPDESALHRMVYLKQHVGGACGTIACIHGLANSKVKESIPEDSPLGIYLLSIRGKTPHDAGMLLADAKEIHAASQASAQRGQTATVNQAGVRLGRHFIAFVEVDGHIWELDGRANAFPIDHGVTNENFLLRTAEIIRTDFMEKDPELMEFGVMALVRQ